MPDLGSGALLRLYKGTCDGDVGDFKDVCEEAVLVQIRGIIPVLSEGDFWPNNGFYLKVSDETHQVFVSLPQRDNEMVMENKLQLGQYIYVDGMVPSFPVPVVVGVRPLPGRHPYNGSPREVNSLKGVGGSPREVNSLKGIEGSPRELNSLKSAWGSPREVNSLEGVGGSPNADNEHDAGNVGEAKRRPRGGRRVDGEREVSDVLRGLRRIYSCFADRDVRGSDSECGGMSNSPTRMSQKRRSWGAADAGVMSIARNEIKAVAREHRRSSDSFIDAKQTPSLHNTSHESSDEDSSTTRRRTRENVKTTKLANTFRSRSCISVKNPGEKSPNSPVNDENCIELYLPWSSLPLHLAKLGKKVLAERNVALQAAVEALQEASASQRVLKCLSTYARHQSSKECGDHNQAVQEFLDFQDDLARTTLILDPITNPRTPQDTDPHRLESERRSNATSWVKSAVDSDLSTKRLNITSPPTPKRTRAGRGSKPNSPFGPKSPSGPKRGSGGPNLHSDSMELVRSLQSESRRQFLVALERFLDMVGESMGLGLGLGSDGEVVEMMGLVRRVNGWLDLTVTHNADSSRTGLPLDEAEIEGYRRVRDKIYDILLKHVERTTMGVGGF